MAKNSSPAFQLYAADFYVDTLDWSCEELGFYFRLLLIEWINGPLPQNVERLKKLSGIHGNNFNKLWRKASEKFVDNGNKKLINQRLEQTRKEQEEYKQLQSIAGKKGVETKKELGIFPFKKSSDPSSDPLNENQATLQAKIKPSSSSSVETENIENTVSTRGKDILALSASGDAVDRKSKVYLTRKKRKLKGQKLEWFLEFWKVFDYAKGKAEAADAWLEIKGLNLALYQTILTGAKQEALNRPNTVAQDKTPKMGQGWLTGKRWEDESDGTIDPREIDPERQKLFDQQRKDREAKHGRIDPNFEKSTF